MYRPISLAVENIFLTLVRFLGGHFSCHGLNIGLYSENIENFRICPKRSKMIPNDPKTLKNMLKHVFEPFGVVLDGFLAI